MKKSVYLVLILLWMSFIFTMSHQTGSQSAETSGTFVKLIEWFHINPDSPLGDLIHLMIRKFAHMFEYFVLYLLCYNYFRYFVSYKTNYYLSLIVSFLYACSDEFHQLFVPNRGPSFTDVLIDTFGATLAMIILIVVNYYQKKRI